MKFKHFLVTTLILLIGIFIVKQIANEVKNKKLIEEEGPRIEKYLRYNYLGIEKITFTGVTSHPTGIPNIIGYVNNDRELEFEASLVREHYNGDLNFLGKITNTSIIKL